MRVLQDDADNVRARLTVAAHAILTGDVARAEAEYRKIEALGREPISVAGLKDVSYYSGGTERTATTEILSDDQASARVGSVSAGRLLAVISEARRLVEHENIVAAIQTLSTAIDTDDHWLLRFERGKAYLDGGYFAEALDEFSTCQARLGEASALFLDDRPTLRYAGALPYWLGRAQESLGMRTAAGRNYGVFIGRRPDGPLADDARQRMQ